MLLWSEESPFVSKTHPKEELEVKPSHNPNQEQITLFNTASRSDTDVNTNSTIISRISVSQFKMSRSADSRLILEVERT